MVVHGRSFLDHRLGMPMQYAIPGRRVSGFPDHADIGCCTKLEAP